MEYNDMSYVQKKIIQVSATFYDDRKQRKDIRIANREECACLYRIGYIQDFIEVRQDYNQGVYENGGKPRRRERYWDPIREKLY